MHVTYSIEQSIELLKNNALIAYPTETFYAVGACLYKHDDFDAKEPNPAINRIFTVKQRALQNPLPLIVKDYKQACEIVDLDDELSAHFKEITSAFWPASLSICLPASDKVPASITAGTGKVVMRQSPHKYVNALLDKLNCPIVSTSANISGHNPVEIAAEISEELKVDLLLNVEARQDFPRGGMPSTIIELLPNKEVILLRKGAFAMHEVFNLGYSIA